MSAPLRKVGVLVAALIGLLVLFAAGFLCDRSGCHDPILTFATFLPGTVGGCPSIAAPSPGGRSARLKSTWKQLEESSSQVEQSPGGLVKWRTPVGDFWSPRESAALFVLAEQLVRDYGDAEYRVRQGDIVLDCGANIGTFTWEALSAGASTVVCIEPVPENVECIERNFRTEIAEGRVLVVPKGVWHRQDTLEMYLYDNSVLDSFVLKSRPEEADTTPRRVQLPLTTIDQIVDELALPRVDFIKMDVEGAERNALRGAQSTLRKHRPRMSISVENLEDDYLVIPELVTEFADDYHYTCGPCKRAGLFQIRPLILYFYF
jgi:FkbM family methyltransferase